MVLQVGFEVGLRFRFFFFLPGDAGGGLFLQRLFNICGEWRVQGGSVFFAPAEVVVEEARVVARLRAVGQVAAFFDFCDEVGEGGAGCALAAFGVKACGDGFERVQQFERRFLYGAVALLLFEGEVVA